MWDRLSFSADTLIVNSCNSARSEALVGALACALQGTPDAAIAVAMPIVHIKGTFFKIISGYRC